MLLKSIVLLTSFVSSVAMAKAAPTPQQCRQYRHELVAMQKAQAAIMQSLVENHRTFSTVMVEYSDLAKAPKMPRQELSKGLKDSAKAFKKREQQGRALSKDFQSASADLLARVAQCL